MNNDRRFRPGWLVRGFPLIAASVAGIACSDSTAPTPAPTKYIVTLAKTEAVAGDSILVKAQLVDADGHDVTTVKRTVSWFVSSGDGHFVDAQTVTDTHGIAGNVLAIGTKAGAGTAILVVDDKQIQGAAPAIPVVAGDPTAYAVTASILTPSVNTSVSIAAQLTDKYGNPTPIAGRVVSWSIDTASGYSYQLVVHSNRLASGIVVHRLAAPTGPRRTSTTGGTFASPSSTTNAQGVATVDFNVGLIGNQSYTVIAKDNGTATGRSAAINVQGGPIAKFVVSVSATDPPAGAPVTLSAYPLDAYGNILTVVGIPLTWSVTGNGGTLSSNATTAASGGSAVNALTTAPVPGTTYTVTVSTPVGSGQASGTSPTITTVEQVSLSSLGTGFGFQSSCGLANDGKVWCWGTEDGFPMRAIPGKPIGNQTMSTLTSGAYHTCGISSGTVLCWGSDGAGELGDNSRTSRSTPAPISSSLSFTAVSAGSAHTCALATTGDIYCWGFSDSGRLGDGTGFSGLGPIKVAANVTFTALSAGDGHTCAIATSGDAYCWGRNDKGQLGIGNLISASTPTPVSGGLKFTAIAAGFDHTCGVVGGTIFCWGDNTLSELGNGQTGGNATAPTAVRGGATLTTFTTVAAGGMNTCAIATDSRAYCWGDNTTSEIGDPTLLALRATVPTAVLGLTFKSIAVGGSGFVQDYYYGPSASGHVCGITTDGVTYCWGSNSAGELGISQAGIPSGAPRKVSGQP